MQFGKSIAFDDDDITSVAAATPSCVAFDEAEIEFIEKLKSGDPEAFDVLVVRHSTDVFSLLCRLTGDKDEAGDLTQETFLSAIKSIGRFRGESGIRTWLFRIAINHSRNRFRWWKRRKRDQTVSLDLSIDDQSLTIGDTLSSADIGPENDLILREREQAVFRELSRLSDHFREVLILCDIEGLGYEEIALTLDVNIGTVKSRIARARQELRKRLKDF